LDYRHGFRSGATIWRPGHRSRQGACAARVDIFAQPVRIERLFSAVLVGVDEKWASDPTPCIERGASMRDPLWQNFQTTDYFIILFPGLTCANVANTLIKRSTRGWQNHKADDENRTREAQMSITLSSRLVQAMAVAVAATFATVPGVSAEPVEMRISVDTAPAHTRNKALRRFIEVLNERTEGQLDIKLYESAQLYKDGDVARALRQGSLEMGVPVFWFLGGMVPEATTLMLPMFYSLDAGTAVGVLDDIVAPWVGPKLEAKTRSHVLGDWLVLGGTSWFSVGKEITTQDDLSGLKVRVPGSTPLIAMAEGMGATVVSIPFSDLPLALSQGTVDGFLSAPDSVVSGKFWDAGVKYAFSDSAFYAAYVPLVSDAFWNKLTPELQAAITGAWRDTIGDARAAAGQAEMEAYDRLEQNGINVNYSSPEDSAKWRARLTEGQPSLVEKMQMDPAFIETVKAEIERRTK
jgi:C4-dicarboxylate-binding protein DctP